MNLPADPDSLGGRNEVTAFRLFTGLVERSRVAPLTLAENDRDADRREDQKKNRRPNRTTECESGRDGSEPGAGGRRIT